jgi:ATP-binding cassette subfamily A (ABC1) protein 1
MKGLAYISSDCGDLSPAEQYSQVFKPFSLAVAGWPVIYMAALSVVYFAAAFGIDVLLSYPAIKSKLLPDKDTERVHFEADEDVEAEEQRVLGGKAEGEAIVVKNLRKVYGGEKPAVRNMTFGIPKGQVVGFLGINGAGKTSTLKMLAADIVPTSGSATLQGHDILHEQIECRRLLGYCPQFDALFELLTVREHLELYARIKGVPDGKMESVVQSKMHEMNIAHFENRCAGTLSGGNKRKLSVAISLIGKPPLVFLDEPSTGMDPVARRFMWNVISRIATKRKECSIILTTHSMEECEALCSNVGIMVGGRFRCLGSIQHLKHRFGKGYLVEAKLQHTNEEGEAAVKRGSERFLQDGFLPADRAKELAAFLGDEARAGMLHPQGSGWAIAAAFATAGRVDVDTFAEWWAFETLAARLNAFMQDTFKGASLVERHGEFFRYKLPELSMALSEAFSALNDAKDTLRIATYSLSQTSLEQIFNLFAAQQDEEKGKARGMGGEKGSPTAGSPVAHEHAPLLE